jgi:hypothetical protein
VITIFVQFCYVVVNIETSDVGVDRREAGVFPQIFRDDFQLAIAVQITNLSFSRIVEHRVTYMEKIIEARGNSNHSNHCFLELRGICTTGNGVGFIFGIIGPRPRCAGSPPLLIIDVWFVNLSLGGTIPIIVAEMMVITNTPINIHKECILVVFQ